MLLASVLGVVLLSGLGASVASAQDADDLSGTWEITMTVESREVTGPGADKAAGNPVGYTFLHRVTFTCSGDTCTANLPMSLATNATVTYRRLADGTWEATYPSIVAKDHCVTNAEEVVRLNRDGDELTGTVESRMGRSSSSWSSIDGCDEPQDAYEEVTRHSITTRSAGSAAPSAPSGDDLSGDLDAGSDPLPDAVLSDLTPRQLRSVSAVLRNDRSVVPAALVTPAEAFSNSKRLAQSGLLAAMLVLLLVFPSQLFNSTWDEHHERIVAAFPRLRRTPTPTPVVPVEAAAVEDGLDESAAADGAASTAQPARTAMSPFVKFLLVAAASAVLGGFLDPSFGLNSASIALVIGVLGALLLGTVISGYAARTYRRIRELPVESGWKSVPAGLAIGAVCVIVSRAVDFRPGYLYGLIGGIAFAAALDKRDTGRSEIVGLAAGLGIALAAWVAFVPVSNAANDGGGFVLQVLDALLASLFIGGVEGALFSLIPVRFMPGHRITQFSWAAWIAAAGLAAFVFVHVLLRPENGYLGTSSTASVAVTYGLFGAFGLASVTFWAWFRYRPAPAAAGPPPTFTELSTERGPEA
jgi:hypothetical protein